MGTLLKKHHIQQIQQLNFTFDPILFYVVAAIDVCEQSSLPEKFPASCHLDEIGAVSLSRKPTRKTKGG